MSGFFGILRSDGREVASDLLQRFADALRYWEPVPASLISPLAQPGKQRNNRSHAAPIG